MGPNGKTWFVSAGQRGPCASPLLGSHRNQAVEFIFQAIFSGQLVSVCDDGRGLYLFTLNSEGEPAKKRLFFRFVQSDASVKGER
jgi:hypothetical protein